MSKIRYAGINRIVKNGDQSRSLLDVSIANKIPHVHECGGRGRCSTCRVRILEGYNNLNPKSASEQKLSITRRWDPSIRLACQAYPKGNVTIERLIWTMGEINQLQQELVPLGGAEERQVAILFCDLRNFTGLSSENLNFDVAFMLNKFYTLLGEPILMNDGIIYQYIGDEIVGVFGTAGGSPQKICRDAVRAAVGMQYALAQLNRVELKNFGVTLKSGVGINFGNAYVGHLGHPSYKQFSIIGDAVNIASRIQAQTKVTNTKILISKSVLDNTGNKIRIGRSIEATLNGRLEHSALYEILGFPEMDVQLELQSSLHAILEEQDQFAKIFYGKVFDKSPEIKKLFKNNLSDQGRMFTHMLSGIVYSFSRPEHLTSGLKRLGENHERYGVRPEYYPIVKEALLETIDLILGTQKTQNTIDAWDEALTYVMDVMKSWNQKQPESGSKAKNMFK